MPKGVARSGKRRCSPRAIRVILCCQQCGTEMRLLPGFLRQHPTTRFCGRRCMGIASRKDGSVIDVPCTLCGVMFQKRRDHLHPTNYCSKSCSNVGRRVEGAKWRDPEQIRVYMKGYLAKNRERVNERARDWTRRNPQRRSATRRMWAAANREWIASNARLRRIGTATLNDWLDVLAEHEGRCAHCGTTERIECDHKVPISKGGRHEKGNLQPLCRRCNAKKGAKIAA